MPVTATKTQGQELTDTLRRYFRISSRTRRYRNGGDLHQDLVEALHFAQLPGYYTERTENALKVGFGVWHAWTKHVDGHRIDSVLRWRITEMSPWKLAALLGRMVDAGVTNAGEGERFFAEMTREH